MTKKPSDANDNTSTLLMDYAKGLILRKGDQYTVFADMPRPTLDSSGPAKKYKWALPQPISIYGQVVVNPRDKGNYPTTLEVWDDGRVVFFGYYHNYNGTWKFFITIGARWYFNDSGHDIPELTQDYVVWRGISTNESGSDRRKVQNDVYRSRFDFMNRADVSARMRFHIVAD